MIKLKNVRENDLEKINPFLKSLIPGFGGIPLEERLEYLSVNPEVFYLVVKVNPENSSETLVGFYTILPLKKQAEDMIIAKMPTDDFTKLEYIAERHQDASCLYLGIIAANGIIASGHTIRFLNSTIHDIKKENTRLYTRPITEKGLDFVERYNFHPIDSTGIGHVFYKD